MILLLFSLFQSVIPKKNYRLSESIFVHTMIGFLDIKQVNIYNQTADSLF